MDVKGLLKALGASEEPLGMFYTDEEPQEGYCPKPGELPTAEMEARGEVDFEATFANFSCVMANIWRARRKGKVAYFSRERFGCLGGAFYLGFLKPQLDFIAHYVSTGIPGVMEGERYFDSPEATRRFFATIDPLPAPARYCVFKHLSRFGPQEKPEAVIFFARPEVICGLSTLVNFVTNDIEAVVSPFGADCSSVVTWPRTYLTQGKLKAVLGGWDPSARKFHRPDELSFTVPLEIWERMVSRWPESFLTTRTWTTVQKKINHSRKVWGEI